MTVPRVSADDAGVLRTEEEMLCVGFPDLGSDSGWTTASNKKDFKMLVCLSKSEGETQDRSGSQVLLVTLPNAP